jgi:hypothetical protein
MSDVIVPEITSVNMPTVLREEPFEVTVSATATDEVGVVEVCVIPMSISMEPVDGWTDFALGPGTAQNGTWSGTIVLSPGIPDGPYTLVVGAMDAAGNEGQNWELTFSIERGDSRPDGTPTPDGSSETS